MSEQRSILQSELEKEAAKVVGKLLEPSSTEIGDLAANIIGGLWGDKVREWRTRRLVELLAQTKKFLDEKGVPIEKAKALPMGQTYTIFEEASKQDEKKISDMWAALLANCMDPNGKATPHPAFVQVLSTIDPLEAKILAFILDRHQLEDAAAAKMRKNFSTSPPASPRDDALQARTQLLAYLRGEYEKNLAPQHQRLEFSLSRLMSLNCIEPNMTEEVARQLRDLTNPFPHRETAVNPAFVAAAISELRTRIEFSRGRAAPGQPIPELWATSGFQNRGVAYSLTSFGRSLLEACTVAKAETDA